ncbi:MAG: restriction endonuclease subunit S [Pseudomonadota bacterium]
MSNTWPIRKLRELADIRVSNVDKKTAPGEKPVKLCNYMDVYSNEYVTGSLSFMEASATAAEIERFGLNKGDVIITKDSETPDDIGISTVVVEKIDDLVCGYHLALIRPNAEQLDSIYLAKQLSTSRVARYFSLHASGSTRYGLPISAIEAVDLPTPSKPEQAKIAEILTTVDRAIEQTEALIAKQQRIKTGLMQDLLTRGIDEHGNLRSEQTHQFKDSPLGKIPVEWETKELRSYLSYLSYGFTNPMPEAQDGPHMVTAANVANGFVQYDYCRRTTVEAYEKLLTKKSRPKIGDILITKDGTLGRLAIVDRLPLCINQSVAVMRPKDGVDNNYLKLLLESPKYQKLILADAGGSTIKHIYISKIAKMVLGVPKGKTEQESIKERLLFQCSLLYQYEANLKKLRSLKTALMQDLLTGKKRVTGLLNDTEVSNL